MSQAPARNTNPGRREMLGTMARWTVPTVLTMTLGARVLEAKASCPPCQKKVGAVCRSCTISQMLNATNPAAITAAANGWTMREGAMHIVRDSAPSMNFNFGSLVDRRMTERPVELMANPRSPQEMRYGEAVNIGFGISANVPRILIEEGRHGDVTVVPMPG